MSRAAGLAGVEPPTAPADRRGHATASAADVVQRGADGVVANSAGPPEASQYPWRPLPTAWLLKASAADLIQRDKD